MILVGMVGPRGGVNVVQPTSGSPDTFPAPFIPAWGAPQGGTADTLAFFPADATGVSLDPVLPDPVSGRDGATLLVLPEDQMVLGVRLAGDAHPRWVLTSDPADGLYMGDGTADPLAAGANVYASGGILGLVGPAGVQAVGLGSGPVLRLTQAGGGGGQSAVYVSAVAPPGQVTALHAGDLCIQAGATSAGLWQATAPGVANWQQVGSGSGGRQTVTVTTTVTVSGTQEQATVHLARSYRLVRVTVDAPCRVRLYTTAANQALDANRTVSEDPAEGSGVVLDYDTVTSPVVFLGGDLSPEVLGSSMEAVPSADIPVTVDLNGPGPAHITFTFFALEI